MAASDSLSGYQFGHEKMGRMNVIRATHQGSDVGELSWADHRGSNARDLSPHEVGSVSVDPAHRRKGVATAMWGHAQGIDPEIAHSGEKTRAGAAWAKSVGGPDPWGGD